MTSAGSGAGTAPGNGAWRNGTGEGRATGTGSGSGSGSGKAAGNGAGPAPGSGTGSWAGLVDDAALFPPGNAPLHQALTAHEEHRAAWYGPLVGPFVFPAPRLGELAGAAGGPPPRVSVTFPGGPAGIATAVEFFAGYGPGRMVSAEVVLPDGMPPADLVAGLTRTVTDGIRVHVEIPRTELGRTAVEALSGGPHHAKLRTGGTVAAAFPGERELAGTITACVRLGVPFKCTAGLHRAVRHTAPGTGFEHHGFLNVLHATAVALGGAGVDAVAAALAERSPARLAASVRGLGAGGIAAARAYFTSYGSCSIREPLDDLIELGLLAPPPSAEERPDDLA